MADKSISFDKSFQIRVLDPESYDEAKKLKDNCIDFMGSTYTFYPNIRVSYSICRNRNFWNYCKFLLGFSQQ
jgi:hypothetical protein